MLHLLFGKTRLLNDKKSYFKKTFEKINFGAYNKDMAG